MFTINPNFIIQYIERDKAIILDTDVSRIYQLNSTASLILKMIKKKKSSSEIALHLHKKFTISLTQADQDVKNLLIDFKKKKILISK